MSEQKIRVLVADDHQLVLDGICSLLQDLTNFEVICKAVDGKEAYESAKMLNPDLLLLDIDMPYMNGLDVLQALKKENFAGKILILTMHAEPALVRKIMQLDADGYLLKTADTAEFEEALYKILSGKKYFSSLVTEVLASKSSSLDAKPPEDSPFSMLSSLSERETEILELIAQGLTNKEIGNRLFISHRTVDTHRTNLMKKLNLTNIAGVIRFAVRCGLVK